MSHTRAESVATVTSISDPYMKHRMSRGGVKASKSSTVSIPSNYQTQFVATQEPFGFNSCAKRFISLCKHVSDYPGPGTYVATNSMNSNKESSSKRGSGGFASKSSRFCRTRSLNLGPGSYSPRQLSNYEDFNRAGVTRNFKKLIIQEKNVTLPQWPSPSSYNITGGHKVSDTAVGFRSKTKRTEVFQVNNYYPGPGNYTPQEEILYRSSCPQRASFVSETKRDSNILNKDVGPGPADYMVLFSDNSKRPAFQRQKHYLCISAPAIPLPALPPPPGPGHYEVSHSIGKKSQLVTGAVFKSTSSRWNRLAKDFDAPGPGAYELQPTGKQSFLFNYNRNWV